MRVIQCTAIPAQSAGASINGKAFSLHGVLYGSVQVNVDGATSLVATAKLQVSNDVAFESQSDRFEPTHWTDLGSAVSVSGTAGSVLLNTSAPVLAYRWARVVYTFTSASVAGTVSATFYGVGA